MNAESYGTLDEITWHAINTYGYIEAPNKVERLESIFNNETARRSGARLAICTDGTRLWVYPRPGTYAALRKEGEEL